MIIVSGREDGMQTRILVRGNFSLDANGLILLLLSLGVTTLGLAGLLAWRGYWPILLIAAVQVVLVAWLLIRVWKNAWIVEDICIDTDHIRISQQRYRSRVEHCLESAWATISLRQPEISWYSAKLILRSGNQQVELGAFLTENEKQSLAKHLSGAVNGLKPGDTQKKHCRQPKS